MSALQAAAKQMAERLRLFKKIATQAEARGDIVVLKPQEMWEPADQTALDAFEAAALEASGAQPLFAEIQ